MKIPTDEEIKHAWLASSREPVKPVDQYVMSIILWGLAQRARAMKAEYAYDHGERDHRHSTCIPDRSCWTRAQWLQAAADEVGVKLEQ